MITQAILKSVLEEIPKEELIKELEKSHDYISLEVFVFNSGHSVRLESKDWSEESETEIAENGNLFCDKDTFMYLLEENGIDYNIEFSQN
jgi:hypothetical protein